MKVLEVVEQLATVVPMKIAAAYDDGIADDDNWVKKQIETKMRWRMDG